MRRREFITLLGRVVLAWPLAARAQQAGKTYRIGWLHPAQVPDAWLRGFSSLLKNLESGAFSRLFAGS